MAESAQRTLLIVKPDGVQRKLVGEILTRVERKGLQLVAMHLMQLTPDQAGRLYRVHEGKPFYAPLVAFVSSSPIVGMVLEGPDAIAVVRTLIGATDSAAAAPGTVRGDFGLSTRHNLVHASDSPASADREISVLFAPEDILTYRLDADSWVYPPTSYDRK